VFWSRLVNAPAEDPYLNGELLLGVAEGFLLVIDPAALNLPPHGHALPDGIGHLPAMLGASFTNLTTLGSPVLKTESLSDLTACVVITIVGQLNLAILIVGLLGNPREWSQSEHSLDAPEAEHTRSTRALHASR
jgi:hypothetical protein